MSGVESTARRAVAPVERAAVGVLVVVVGAFAVSTIPGVRAEPGFATALDGWLRVAGYLLATLVAVMLAVRSRAERSIWWLLALALGLRAAGFLVHATWVRWQVPQPYPSIADALWLLGAVVIALVLLARIAGVAPRMSLLLVLDGLAGALVAAGLALVVVVGLVEAGNAAGLGDAAIATNVAYPVLDVLLLVLAGGLLASTGSVPRFADLALLVGVVGFAAVDVTYLVQLYDGTFRSGTWLSALSLGVTALLALTPLIARVDPPATTDQVVSRGAAATATIATGSVAFFVYATLEQVPVVSTLLVAAALMFSIIRGVLTLLGDRIAAGEQLRSANEDFLRFQALVETSKDFIAIAGMDGQVQYLNPGGRDMIGMSRDRDVTETTIVDYLTPEGIQASLDVEQPAVVAHGHWEGESTLRDQRGGPPIPVAISSFLMHHPDTGEPFALATVQRDITERRAADQAVLALASERQLLLARLVQAQEDERAEIAADVHDDSVQALAAVDLRLGLLRRRLLELDDAELLSGVDKTIETVQGATARLRHLLFDLESPALESSLADALRAAADFVFEDTRVEWALTGDPTVDLPTAQRVTAYRIAKEAMTNVRKHARAARVEIGLARGEDGVLVTVADDGVGMHGPVRHQAGHRGLASVRDRATIAGGWLRVEAAEGEGTRVFVWLPDVAPVDTASDEEVEEAGKVEVASIYDEFPRD